MLDSKSDNEMLYFFAFKACWERGWLTEGSSISTTVAMATEEAARAGKKKSTAVRWEHLYAYWH